MPALSENDFRQGATILSLIEDWSSWVHRRVEHVTLADPQTSERKVSLDFTLAPDPATPPISNEGHDEAYLVPVTWIAKHRITRFSLRDESGQSLAALTQIQTAVVATALLAVAAAEIVQQPTRLTDRLRRAQVRQQFEPVPPDVLQDLWVISSSKRPAAIDKCRRFYLPPPDALDLEKSLLWRESLFADDGFMTHANDVARNFLILSPLAGRQGSRRIIKLSYDEQRIGTPLGQRDRREAVPGLQASKQTTTSDRCGDRLRLYLWELQRFFGLRTKRIKVPASSVGRAQCYHLEVDVPEGIRLTHAKLIGYSPEDIIPRSNDSQPIDQPEGDDQKIINTVSEGDDPSDDTHSDVVVRGSQCAHLHLANIPRSFTGVGIISLRLRDELVLRGAWINAVFSVVLLALVAIFLKSYEQHTDATVAVLLGIPGGVSLYLARPREPGMSAAMHSGVRLLALGNAIVAFAAIAVVLAGGKCTMSTKTNEEQICTTWRGTQTSLTVLAVCAGIMLFVLSIGYFYSRWPPELRGKNHRASTIEDTNGAFG